MKNKLQFLQNFSRSAGMITLALLAAVGLALCAQAQTVTVIAEFNGTNGNSPNGMVQGTDGNLYGSTFAGGAFDWGEIFRLTPSGQIGTVYSFHCEDKSCVRSAYLLATGSDGNFYGISVYGGNEDGGVFYRVTPGGKFTVLHNFCYGTDCMGGQNPNGLFLGFDGNFYGTTAYGGKSNQGVFFRISPKGEFKVLHAFCLLSDCQDGNFPLAPIQGQDGNFYGTTAEGGTQGAGVIYKLTPDGTYEVIHNFCSHDICAAGGVIQPLVQDAKGNLFGITSGGGTHGFGAVFELTAEHHFKILHSFAPHVDGGDPNAGLVLANDGNLYGVNLYGKYGEGTAFEVTPEGEFTLQYTFQLAGNAPYVPLFQSTNGLLYGTLEGSNGTVFQLSNNLSPLIETIPTGGKVGKRVLILGNGLTGATSVTFNGMPAEFKVQKDSFITATVPAGATTGTVSVVTRSGTLNSNPQFVVTK
jgi:uncharacterized repeat protein (TIGR03803 family)